MRGGGEKLEPNSSNAKKKKKNLQRKCHKGERITKNLILRKYIRTLKGVPQEGKCRCKRGVWGRMSRTSPANAEPFITSFKEPKRKRGEGGSKKREMCWERKEGFFLPSREGEVPVN